MKRINYLFVMFLTLLATAAYAIKTPEIQMLRQWPDAPGLYEKFEVSFNINNQNEYKNPFDPDEIDITAVFTSPTGRKWTIPGFYNYSWKIRFSPDETGSWSYILNVIDKGGKITSDSKSFVAVNSSKKGPLKVAANKRYLVHSDNSDFYGVGLWYNDGYTDFNRGSVKPQVLDNLKSLGVNFISTYITPLETLASGIGRYDQNICGRLDELLLMLEDRDMVLSLNLWFHSFLASNANWGRNPYQQVTDAKDFFKSDIAWKYQEKLYRYFIARWGYSRALGIWFVVDEINDTDGWRTKDYTAAAAWGKKVHDYFKMHDPWDRPTTGTRAGGIKEYWDDGYKIFDIAAREIYESQGWPNNRTSTIDSAEVHPLTSSYRNYAEENKKLWKLYGKPVINGETGWDHTFYEPSMPGYLTMYHNAMWATMATGSAMTPFWWSYSDYLFLNDNIINSRLTCIKRFTDKIPFSKLTDINPAEIKCLKGDAYAMKSNEFIYGWVVNSVSDVAGEKITISSLKKGKYNLKIYHTWRGKFLTDSEVNCTDGTITFETPYLRMGGLGEHANYIGQDMAFILEYLP
ncbi:MAG: DUF5060 domain-containing protein [Sphingobacteriaceae bacterium]